MDILPAIDLREGKVVRLKRGDYADQVTYSEDPAAVARTFSRAGAAWVHVVDLDAAKSGCRVNFTAIAAIRRATGARIELGGGARDDTSVRAMLDLGAERVVIGSAALADWAWFERLAAREEMAGRLALGLDAREGKLAIHGWTEQTQTVAVEIAARVKGWPLGAIVYTDINRDGMLEGPNIEATAGIVEATDVPVVASGGVSTIEDVLACKRIGCGGAIIGKAFYEGRIDLTQACRRARE